MASKKPTTFSMRMPEDLNEKIQAYATEHSCTKAEAMSHFARAGIELEERGGAETPAAPAAPVASAASDEALARIEERLEALSATPAPVPESGQAIIPVDMRDVIQAYSAQHECSEQEALAYYARIGVQASAADRPASTREVAELQRRIDVLAQDSQAKSEQLRQMAEMLVSIRDYTKPEELELEGEVAEQEAEDAEDVVLSDEERQRIADEHTRKIVSDVMGDYMTRQQEEMASREAAREAQMAAREATRQSSSHASLVPVLVAIIVSLIMGLIVILTR